MSDDNKILEDGEQRNEQSLTALVTYNCVTTPKTQQLKTTIFMLMNYASQEFEEDLAGTACHFAIMSAT